MESQLEMTLKQAIKQEKESFKRLHASHQSHLAFLRSQLKYAKRNNIATIEELVSFRESH